MADYIVGDIQGCLSGLKALLSKVDFNPLSDTLYAVGDLIGRGPDSLDTLAYLHAMGDNFQTVLGNHDLNLLAIYCGVRRAKKADKLDALIASVDFAKYCHWLRQKPLAMHITPNILLTHAGLYPNWSFAKALSLSAEISETLRGEQWQHMVKMMYGDEPSRWTDDLTGDARQRFIINAFTRMRFLENDLRLEFECKLPPRDAPRSLTPWFVVNNSTIDAQQKVVFGHWAALNGETHDERFIALDTGFVWGGHMTLLCVDSLQLIQK
ncbi:symmetrical bis(5'-nucleosyl)-tetraphosphatase [Paraglaciecola polaris]|uniref:symmetrical bis(5'-nucleosyl)-tetraphosphatase n=1 Tax=Paraglaciecola polaris TaxID=222814 RepID=UPI0030EEC08B|tara:strand:- start:3123 stop:3923 length:801 start_codon:yes stop_codon:yes gene_type:complete